MEACISDPSFDVMIKEHDFDWYEAFAGGAATASLQWLYDYPLARLLRAEKTLQIYVELSLLLGNRATETIRANAMSQVRQIGGRLEVNKAPAMASSWPRYAHTSTYNPQWALLWWRRGCRNFSWRLVGQNPTPFHS